jgi:PhnB protein
MEHKDLFWFDNVDSRPHPWPGLMWLTTILPFSKVKEARDLYVKAFKFVPIFELPSQTEANEFDTVRLRFRGANILLVKEGLDYEGQEPAKTGTPAPFNFYLYVDDATETYNEALKNGMTSVMKPAETFWGDIRARVKDPFGYVWDIAHRKS